MQKIDIRHKSWNSYAQIIKFASSWSPIDLTWCTIVFTMKDDIKSLTPIKTKNLTITNASLWETKLELNPVDTSSLLWSYYYDVELTDASWFVTTIFWGSFIIEYNI